MAKIKLKLGSNGNVLKPVMTVARMEEIMAEHPDQCVSNASAAGTGEDIIKYLADCTNPKCLIPEEQVLWTI